MIYFKPDACIYCGKSVSVVETEDFDKEDLTKSIRKKLISHYTTKHKNDSRLQSIFVQYSLNDLYKIEEVYNII